MKRFFVSFLLSLMVMCLPFAAVKITSHAEGAIAATTISLNYNVRDSFRYSGAVPTSADTYSVNISLKAKTPPLSECDYSLLFPNVTTSDSVELFVCNSTKDAYTSTESGGYTVLTTYPTGVRGIKYNSSQMIVDIDASYVGAVDINYYGRVTSATPAYDTDMGKITLNISNRGIYYKNGYTAAGIVIPVEDASNYTFDEEYFKNYILCAYDNGTTIPVSEFEIGTPDTEGVVFEGIDITNVNTTQSTSCVVYQGEDILFMDNINLVIYQENVAQDTLTMIYNGTPIPDTTASDRYTIAISAGETITGTIDCINGWSAISLDSNSTDFNVSYRIEGEDGEEYISYAISQKTLAIGSFELNLVLFDSIEEYEKNVYLTINVTTAIPPTIMLRGAEINVPKNTSFSDVYSMFRGNVESIVLFDGSYVDESIIENPLKVIIECDITAADMVRAGSYNISYSYTDQGLTGTATAVLNIIDESPELYNTIARVSEDNSLIVNDNPNYGVAMGTEIYFVLAAMDEDGDDITYHGAVNNNFGTLTQDGTDATLWRFTPAAKTAGEIVFTFYASDGNSTSEYVYYTIYYLDTAAPTIIFANDVREVGGEYYLDVSRKVIIDFNNYIVSVSDNSDPQPSNNDVVITANGFTFLEGKRFKFENVTGNFSVDYSLTDAAGNERLIKINIVIENEAPTAENVYAEGAYQDTISLDIYNKAKDDTKIFSFVAVGMITDSTGNPVETDIYNFNANGKIEVKFSTKYNEGQGRRVPFVGKAYIRYKVVDGDDVSSPEYAIELDIKDGTKPVVSAVEGTRTNFIRGREYPTFTKEGYFTAMDEIDGVLTPTSITLLQYESPVASIDFSRLGEYKLVYVFEDSAGNSETKELTLTITGGQKPTIELLAEGTTISQGGSFNMYDFIVSIKDEEDGTKTSGWKAHEESGFLIVMDDSVNTKKAGRYEIRMFCVDNDGNASDEVIFTLLVEEPPQGFPIWILYIIGGAVGLILAIVIIRVIVVKRRMRI